MILEDLHIHTNFSDGENKPEEMVMKAMEMGLEKIGFSDHSYTWFDPSYCLSKARYASYKECIANLKRRSPFFTILCGIEQDYWSEEPVDDFDYVIGSVHYVKFEGPEGPDYMAVDEAEEFITNAANMYCGGDIYTVCEKYFETVADVVNKTHCNIIGHFDIISKFDEQSGLFDETNPRYIAAWKKAVDALIPYGVPFEINTGAIKRGIKTHPYPSSEIIEYIKEKGGKFVLSSDAHDTESIAYQFDKYEELL